jgi:coenzyme F420-reducing hydrogenase delta subunit
MLKPELELDECKDKNGTILWYRVHDRAKKNAKMFGFSEEKTQTILISLMKAEDVDERFSVLSEHFHLV